MGGEMRRVEKKMAITATAAARSGADAFRCPSDAARSRAARGAI